MTTLRRTEAALDAINSFRKRIYAGGWVAVAVTFGVYFWLDHVARTSDNLKRVMLASVFALTCVIAWSTFALTIVFLRLTKRILRAIVIVSRDAKDSEGRIS
jgi:hypothetical protein